MEQQATVVGKRFVEFRKPICPYVSSTPHDFITERDFLKKKIFPDINAYCQLRGTYFGPTDIKWKPSDPTVKSGQFLRLSLDYVTKCSPFFICLLGETYGPCRPPDSILLPPTYKEMPEISECKWFEKNLSIAASAGYEWVLQQSQQYGSFTEMEIMQSHLIGEIERSYFYIRQPEHLEKKYPDLSWQERQIVGKTFLPENEYYDLKIRDLKQWIVNNGKTVRYFSTLDELGKMVTKDWCQVIDLMYPSIQNTVDLNIESNRLEISNQCLMETKTESYLNLPETDNIMETLTKFSLSTLVRHDPTDDEVNESYLSPSVLNAFRKKSVAPVKKESIIVLCGDRGTGKTSLIANWLKYFKEESMDITCILNQFFGCATNFTDVGIFMKYCTKELRKCYFAEDPEENKEIYFEESTENFQEIYQSFAAALTLGPCVLVMDGVDEIGESCGHSVLQIKELDWLPMPLPSTCKIILSTTSSDLTFRSLCRRPDVKMIKMPLFTQLTNRIDYLKTHLHRYFDNFKPNDIKDILSLKMTCRPLFLSLLTSQMCLYEVYTNLTKYVDSLMEVTSVRDLWDKCIRRWTKQLGWLPCSDEEENIVDAEYSGWVGDILKLIALSRNGLSQTDLLSVLKNLKYNGDKTVTTLDWLKFRLFIGRALYEKPDGLFTYTHQHLKEIVEYVLLKSVQSSTVGRKSNSCDNFWKQRKRRYHYQLAKYFLSLPYSQRCLEEIPWHLLMAGELQLLRQFLSKPQVFIDMMASENHTPSMKQNLFLYWNYMKEEGIDPTTNYCQLLNTLGFVELDIIEEEESRLEVMSPTSSNRDDSQDTVQMSRQNPDRQQNKEVIPQICHSTPRIVTIPPGSVNSGDDLYKGIDGQTSFDAENQKQIVIDVDKEKCSEVNHESEENDNNGIFLTQPQNHPEGSTDSLDTLLAAEEEELTDTQLITLTWLIGNFLLDLKQRFVAKSVFMALNNKLKKLYPLSVDNHLCHARVQELLGILSEQESHSEEAEKWYRKALRTVSDICIEDGNSSLFRDVENLKGKLLLHFGRLHFEEKSFDMAEDLLCEALDSFMECNNIPQKSAVLYHMGLLWERRFEYQIAETLLRNALSICQAWYGTIHLTVADTLFALSRVLSNTENRKGYNVKEAIHLLRKTVYILEKLDGDRELTLACTLFELGKLLRTDNTASTAEAAETLRRAYDIRATKLGDDNVLTKESRKLLSEVEIMNEFHKPSSIVFGKRTIERPFSGMTFREKELNKRRTQSHHSLGSRATSASSLTRDENRRKLKNDVCVSEHSYPDTLMSLPASERILLNLDRPKSVHVERRPKSSSSLLSLEHEISNFSLASSISHRRIPPASSQTIDSHSTYSAPNHEKSESNLVHQINPSEATIDCFAKEIEAGDVMDVPPKYNADSSQSNATKTLYKRIGSAHVSSINRCLSAQSRGSSAGGSTVSTNRRYKMKTRPHSSHIGSMQAVTYGPKSTIHSLLGSDSSSSSTSHKSTPHRTAWYHAPQRFTGPNKYISQNRPISGNPKRMRKMNPRNIPSAPPKFRYIPVDALEERRKPEPTVSFLDAVVVG